MRTAAIALAALALYGCGTSPSPRPNEDDRRLSKSILEVMCGDDAEDRAHALSKIVEATNDDDDHPDQSVYDEASSYIDKGCPEPAEGSVAATK